MYKIVVIAAAFSVVVAHGAFAKSEAIVPAKSISGMTSFHGPVEDSKKSAGFKLDRSVKKKKLVNYPQSTIGDAFDGYHFFAQRDWVVTQSTSGNKIYVDFTGMFKKGFFSFLTSDKGISQRGLTIKIVIYPDGEMGVAMVSKIEVTTDGMRKIVPLEDAKSILDKIYTNQEVVF